MSDQTEEIKQKVDIVSIISERVELKRAGRNFKAPCPFHNEKTPSFMVSPELQIFKCFGCGEAGDVISFLEKFEGMDFGEALKYLAERAGVKLEPGNFEVGGEKQKLYEINKLAAKFYQYLLFNHPSAKVPLNYLVKRNLKIETIKTFAMGYSLTNSNTLVRYFVDKKKYRLEELEKVGLIYQRGGGVYERFADRIIFPLFDHKGNVNGFSGRILPGRESTDVGKYINTPETPIYHKSNILYGLNLVRREIKALDEVVVVEGELDVITPWQAGIKNIVAIKGSALTQEQAKLLSRFSQNVVLALDSDAAGNLAARRGIEIAEGAGLRVKVAILGNYKDPDEMAVKDPEALKKAIKEAVPIWDFIINLVFAKHGSQTGEGKAGISRELIPTLAKINDEIVQAHYIGEVANRLNVPYEAVFDEIRKIEGGKEAPAGDLTDSTLYKTGDRREMLEKKLISLTLFSDPVRIINKDFCDLIKTAFSKKLLEEYQNYMEVNKKYDFALFSKSLPEELKEGFSEMVLINSGNYEESDKEIPDVKREILLFELKENQERLAQKIGIFEKEGDREELKKAKMEFNELLKDRLKLEKSLK